MNKTIKSILIIFIFLLSIYLYSCTKEYDSILEEAFNTIKIEDEIYENINLKNEIEVDGKIVNVRYESDSDVLSNEGNVSPYLDEDVLVNLNCILSYGDNEKTFKIENKKVMSIKKVCDNAINEIKIPSEVNKDLDFKTNIGNVKLKWNTSNTSIISKTGTCSYISEDKEVTITCTFTYKTDLYNYKIDKTYNVIVKPWDAETRFEKAYQSLEIPEVVTSNISLKQSFDYGVKGTWDTSDNEAISKVGNVTRFNEDKIVNLKLTLSLDNDNSKKEYTFEVKVLKNVLVEGEMYFGKHIKVDRARDLNANQMVNLKYDESLNRIVLADDATVGTYESLVINCLDFYRIVGSFSCITNQKATCELEYSINVDGLWSKYLSYGEYGLGRQNLYYNQVDTNAMIDTDMVVPLNGKTGTAFKYRITLRRNTLADESPKLSLIGTCLFLKDYTYAVDASKLPDSVDWEVPKLNQNIVPVIGNSICSATTTTMLLKYAGYDFTDKGYTYEHEYMANMVADRGHNNPTYGNWSYNMITAGAFGVNAYVGKYYSWDEIRYHLANFGPLGVSIGGNFGAYTTEGHLLVLRGYRIEDGKTTVICNDPNIKEVYYEVSLETFLRCWGSVVYIMEFDNKEVINFK